MILFAVAFSVLFFWIRNNNILPLSAITGTSPTSTASLYSIIGIFYSIVTGFIVQNQWNIWDKLIEACNAEISNFRQLNLLIHHFPEPFPTKINGQIKRYLRLLVNEFWKDKDIGVRTEELKNSLTDLEDTLFYASEEVPKLNFVTLSLLNEIVKNRELRLHYSSRHLPTLIRFFVMYMTFTMIGLSLFIAVNNIWYDYIFTISVATLCFNLFLIVDDLEHPYRPGTWHVSMKEYVKLLEEMEK